MKSLMFLTAFISALLFPLMGFSEEKAPTKTFLWVIAHEPIGLFQEAANQFSQEVLDKTGGSVKIEVMTLPQYAEKYNNGKKISSHDFLALVKKGKIQFSQTYSTELGKLNKDMYVLDLPFLFRDHDHAKNVLEGEVGEQLLASLSAEHVRGLAFTYSGGYRILPSKKSLTKVEDFKGLKIRTSGSPVAKATFKAIGATPVPMELDQIDEAIQKGQIAAAESTYPRFYSMKQNTVAPYVVESFHSLFLTTILINDDVWKALSKDEQNIVKTAAVNAARSERTKSLADTEEIRKQCEKDGIKLVQFDQKEKERMQKATESVYKKFDSKFKPGLLKAIVATK